MEIFEVSHRDYSEVIESPFHSFGLSEFNELNRKMCDCIFYLLFKDRKYRLGIIGGVRDNAFFSPFSAPFGGFSYLSSGVRINTLEESIELLVEWAKNRDLQSINMTLPPRIYETNFISKQINCLWRYGFKISNLDLNYSYNLESFDENYSETIWSNARKNLRIALKAELQLKLCFSDDEKRLAYDIIYHNRKSRGYPLRMSWQQVSDTVHIIQADSFLVCKSDQTPIASAIVFHISKFVVQVVYWGDMKGFSDMKPMNFLSYKVFEYYKNLGMKVVDIGPSTESSVPNYGLSEFKESIGSCIEPKYSFTKNLR